MKTRIQKNLPPGPGRGGRRCAVSQLRLRSARRRGRRPAKPKQLIVMFTHYGCITTKCFPVEVARRPRGRRPHADQPRGARAVCRQAPHPARHPRDERVDAEQQRHGAGRRAGERPPPATWSGRTSPCSRSRPTAPTRSASTRRRSSTPSRSAARWITSWRSSSARTGRRCSCGLATGTTARSRLSPT